MSEPQPVTAEELVALMASAPTLNPAAVMVAAVVIDDRLILSEEPVVLLELLIQPLGQSEVPPAVLPLVFDIEIATEMNLINDNTPRISESDNTSEEEE